MSYCVKCGAQLQSGVAFCSSCGQKVGSEVAGQGGPEKSSLGDNAGMRFLLPIGCSGWAIAAGYCGLFSILPLIGIPLALLSVIFGIVAICVIARNPHKHGIARIIIGWVFVAISVVVQFLVFSRW